MAERFINGKVALSAFIQDLAVDVRRRIDVEGGRTYNASGRLKRSVSADVSEEFNSPKATLTALSYWRYVGNGRGPGKMPPIERLRQWALDKGLADTEAEAKRIGGAIAAKIAKEGSLDYKQGGTNIFDDAISAMQPRVGDVLQAFLHDAHDLTVSQFNRAFAA